MTTGIEYDVHAVAVFEGSAHLQVVDDIQMPAWLPAWIFDQVENSMPNDWICSFFAGEPSLVIGPSFIADSLAAYASMVELEPDQVDRFWARLKGVRQPTMPKR